MLQKLNRYNKSLQKLKVVIWVYIVRIQVVENNFSSLETWPDTGYTTSISIPV